MNRKVKAILLLVALTIGVSACTYKTCPTYTKDTTHKTVKSNV